MSFDTDKYYHIDKDQHNNPIPMTLIVSKDFKEAKQYRKKGKKEEWVNLKITDGRFNFQNPKSCRLSILQVKKIINYKDPKIDEDMIECEKYRNYTFSIPLYRKAKLIEKHFTYFDYYQDQQHLNPKEDVKLCIDHEEDIQEDIKISLDPIRFKIKTKQGIIEVNENDLNIEYNLRPDCDLTGFIQYPGFTQYSVFHDPGFHTWYQKMENGWYYQYFGNTMGCHPMFRNDKDKWIEIPIDIQTMKTKPDLIEPVKEVVNKTLWQEEEEELELPYFAKKASLFHHEDRPRELTLCRLNKQEKFLKMSLEEKNEYLKKQTINLMKTMKE
jgi:hypothetical protein